MNIYNKNFIMVLSILSFVLTSKLIGNNNSFYNYPIHSFFSSLEQKDYNPKNVKRAIECLEEINLLFEKNNFSHISNIKYSFLEICNQILDLDKLKNKNMTKLKADISKFDSRLRNYIFNHKCKNRDTKFFIEKALELNWLLLNNFLEDETLFDRGIFSFKSPEKVLDNKSKAFFIVTILGGIIYYLFFTKKQEKKIKKEELENIVNNTIPREEQIYGFKNLGNTCYMNSILQVLLQSKPLLKGLKKIELNEDSMTNAFIKLHENKEKSNKTFDPSFFVQKYFHDNEVPLNNQFKQEDACEFLDNLLNNGGVAKNGDFYFISKTNTRCCNCDKDTEVNAFNNRISLEIKENGTKLTSLLECLNESEYVKSEILEKYKCHKCSATTIQTSSRKTHITRYPNILILSLNRYNKEGQKKESKVSFPYADFSLPDSKTKYDLRGIVYHKGSTQSGHYTSIAKNSDDSKWYYFNDEQVSQISTQRVINSANLGVGINSKLKLDERTTPYIFFYEKRNVN